MGFLDSIKGASMNFGTVDSPDFSACYLTTKGDHFMITGGQAGTYEFKKADIAEFKVVASGGTWIKYKMAFKDGKIAIIHSFVKASEQGGGGSKSPFKGVEVAPIERYFGDLL